MVYEYPLHIGFENCSAIYLSKMIALRGKRKRKLAGNVGVNGEASKQQKILVITVSDEEDDSATFDSSTSDGLKMQTQEVNACNGVNECNGDVKNASTLDSANLKENSLCITKMPSSRGRPKKKLTKNVAVNVDASQQQKNQAVTESNEKNGSTCFDSSPLDGIKIKTHECNDVNGCNGDVESASMLDSPNLKENPLCITKMPPSRGRPKKKLTENMAVNVDASKQQTNQVVTVIDEENGSTSFDSSTSDGNKINSHEINCANGCNGNVKNSSTLDSPNSEENPLCITKMPFSRGRPKKKLTENVARNGNSSKQQKNQALTVSDEENEPTSFDSSTSDGNKIKSHEINGANGCNGDVKNPSMLDSPNLKENPLNSFHAKFRKSNTETKAVRESCSAGKHVCFACKIADGVVTKCSVNSCDKYYHEKCLETLPSVRTEAGACPLHLCLTCYNANSKNPNVVKGQMYKCFKCPTAFHTKDECIIPGSVILTHDVMSCPDHFSPEQFREWDPVTNLLFCIRCGCNQDLMFCNFCPASVHEKCLRKKYDTSKQYVCDRCECRRVIFFNDIVWAKIYNFRWWPAKVLNPKKIPANVQQMNHYDGEFPIQFFGSNEYFWTQKGRVYPFVVKNVGLEDFDVQHNYKKQVPDPVFEDAINLALQAVETKNAKSLEPIDGKKLPNYRHIKSNRPIGTVQIYTVHDLSEYNVCGCKQSDKDPCGYDSLCLNRNMCIECHPEICESGELCQNQKFVKRQYAPVQPFYTEDRGWGLKALEDIKEGHFVIEYMGDLIDEQECDRRIQEKQVCGDTNFYFCRLDSNRIIDAGPKGNFSRFMNHSCDPNCETQKWLVNGDNRVGIFAKQDIPAGSELTFDYEMDFSHFEKLKCNCKSARCSGLIGKKPQNGAFKSPGKEFNCTVKLVRAVVNGDLPKEKPLTNGKNKPLCYKCGKSGKLLICSHDSCSKGYHIRCINTNVTKTDEWRCPIHFCKKCQQVPDYVCHLCPNAFCKKHVKPELLSNKTFACGYHAK